MRALYPTAQLRANAAPQRQKIGSVGSFQLKTNGLTGPSAWVNTPLMLDQNERRVCTASQPHSRTRVKCEVVVAGEW